MKTLFITTALEGMSPGDRERHPASGRVFAFPGTAQGIPEPQVIP